MPEEILPDRQVIGALTKSGADQVLRSERRWGLFYTPVDENMWRRVLGPSANVWEHTLFFYRLSHHFASAEPQIITPSIRRQFLLGELVHDLGEYRLHGAGVGDMPWFLRTPESDRQESAIAHALIHSLDLDPPLKNELATAYQAVARGADATLHHAHRALERSDYVLTALRVHAAFRRGLTVSRSLELVGKVIVNDLYRVLSEFVHQYPASIGRYISHRRSDIDAALADATPYLQSQPDTAVQLTKFTSAWIRFTANPPRGV